MRAPAFWYDPSRRLAPALLSPVSPLTAWLTARRLRQEGWHAPVPVVCCGNLSVGGTGKTTLVLDLLDGLRRRGRNAHALTRGYRGAAQGVVHVDPLQHDAALVGDEALLLAGQAPCWVARDRGAAARAAVADGAEILVLDDGLQNPTLRQDWPLLVIDGASGFGNGRLLPAGPLREPLAAALPRVRAAVLIGADRHGVADRLPRSLPLMHAELEMDQVAAEPLRNRPVLAFAGIGRPGKFFDALPPLGLTLLGTRAFPDHHRYRSAELERLRRDAARLGATLVTTPKDAVRLPPAIRREVAVLGVRLRWQDEAARTALLDRMLP